MARASIARIAGRTELPTGERVVWSVADGRRGRRWRELALDGGVVIRSTLFETDPDGRLVRLEIATAAGLLTLHPAGVDGALHGNVVGADGVRHLALGPVVPFVEGSPVSLAVLVSGIGEALAVGRSLRLDVVELDDRLVPRPASPMLTRLDERTWRLTSERAAVADAGEGSGPGPHPALPEPATVRLDRRGLPVSRGAIRWPLELDPG